MDQKEAETSFEKQIRDNESIITSVCRMYAFNRADRDDLYQEIVIQVWKAFKSYRGESLFSSWLYRVAINTAITGLQKKSRSIQTDNIESLTDAAAADHQPENDLSHELHLAIQQLNDVEKAIVMLYLQDLSYDEMQNILGIRESTLRVKMNRIKQKLKKLTNH